MEIPNDPEQPPVQRGPRPVPDWEWFHDRLDAEVEGLGEGEFLDLTQQGSSWRIRISAGWPGVDGPGTLAYHLQIGSDHRGELGAWSSTPFARSHGYSATRVAGEISSLGLESDSYGTANPSMIACGSVAHLEVADVAVELLREAFRVPLVDTVHLAFGDGANDTSTDAETVDRYDTAGGRDAPDGHTGYPNTEGPMHREAPGYSWWSRVRFDTHPEPAADGESVVGHVDNILVELTRDRAALPGLTLMVARARLTDPNAVPVALPAADAAALLRWMRTAGGDGISVDTVRSGGRTVHGWATRMVCGDGADAALARIEMLDGPDGDEDAAAEAVAEVVRFVRSARRSAPQVIRPTRLMATMED
jgi:hypothetical protein